MRHCWRGTVMVFLVGLYVSTVSYGAIEANSDQVAQGKKVFEKSCEWCHGHDGEGDGPAAFFHLPYSGPRPMDFSIANYRLRSTPSGYLPTDQDLFRTITQGIPGYMPSFSGLTPSERWSVISYIKMFHPEDVEGDGIPIVVREVPLPATSHSLERGRSLYFKFECHSCHGVDGRGQETVSPTEALLSDQELPVFANDLTNRHAMKNGSSSRDIVRTLLTGMNGTPMPSYASQFEAQPDDAWHVANFVLSLSASN